MHHATPPSAELHESSHCPGRAQDRPRDLAASQQDPCGRRSRRMKARYFAKPDWVGGAEVADEEVGGGEAGGGSDGDMGVG